MAKLYFRYGTVGSAKTLNLIAVAHNYMQQGKAVAIAKPALDVRFGRERVASRAQLSKQATIIIDDDTVLVPSHFTDIDCLVVDEVQFLHPRHIEIFREIADAGCPVICYGLRTDFRRNLFAGSRRLLELADAIEEVKTTCYYCNRKAIFSLKLLDDVGTLSGAQVELGCEEKYVPTCSGHFHEKTKHELIAQAAAAAENGAECGVAQAVAEAQQCKDENMSSKFCVPPTNMEEMAKTSRSKILALRQAIAVDNGVDPATIVEFEYKDPLDEKQQDC